MRKKKPARTGGRRNFLDGELSVDDINSDTYSQIEKMSPFGEGNLKPLFIFNKLKIDDVLTFGKNKEHLKLEFLNSKGNKIEAISFFRPPMILRQVLKKTKK